jgi:hypothetical protein
MSPVEWLRKQRGARLCKQGVHDWTATTLSWSEKRPGTEWIRKGKPGPRSCRRCMALDGPVTFGAHLGPYGPDPWYLDGVELKER